MVCKKFYFKNHVLGMKLKTSFSKRDFGKKHGKKMGYQTDPWPNVFTYENLCLIEGPTNG